MLVVDFDGCFRIRLVVSDDYILEGLAESLAKDGIEYRKHM